MSLETAKKSIDMLFDKSKTDKYFIMEDMPAVILEFIGGEPLLEIELIDQIMDYFIQQCFIKKSKLGYRYMISMSTNGTLYHTPKVQEFIKKWRNHLSIGVTVDGNKELHDSCRVFEDGSGSFDLAISAAKDELEINSTTATKFTVSPYNIEYLINALKYDIDFGYKNIFINCVYEEG